MSGRMIAIVAFALLAAVQWYAVVSMIWERETVLEQGELVRFRSELVDPSDPFRGRYVMLGVNAGEAAFTGEFDYGDDGYATLTMDDEGFASYDTLHKDPPEDGLYLRVKYGWEMNDTGRATIVFPFDRYYLNETIAPEAERVYREVARDEAREAWLEIRILDGDAVLAGLYIEGVSVEDYVRGVRLPSATK